MLKEIYIQNLAVIKEAVIPLTNDLNIFTGETGAGKSILINGINAVLGQRCTKDIVRTGCDKAVITALFTELSEEITAKLDELGISHESDEITLTREISADGGSVARINHRTASASLLREIGAMLINIHGQHDNQILLDSARHLQILDDFGGDDTLLEEYRMTFRELQQTARKLGELKKQEQTRIERSRYLNEIIDELGKLELSAGEDDELEKEYSAAKNSEKTVIAIKTAIQAITGEQAANDMIISAESELSGFTEAGSALNVLYERLAAVEIELADIASELEGVADKVELDGQRLEFLANRLSAINRLKRKYALDSEGLVKLYDDACREINQLDSARGEIEALSAQRLENASSGRNQTPEYLRHLFRQGRRSGFAFRLQQVVNESFDRFLVRLVQQQVLVEHVPVLPVQPRRKDFARRDMKHFDDSEENRDRHMVNAILVKRDVLLIRRVSERFGEFRLRHFPSLPGFPQPFRYPQVILVLMFRFFRHSVPPCPSLQRGHCFSFGLSIPGTRAESQ